MKHKLTIADGIIHRTQILFLDEPTTGIDVASARQLRQLIADLHSAGTSIFLTTYYIKEAERLHLLQDADGPVEGAESDAERSALSGRAARMACSARRPSFLPTV
jgi:ABC-type Na+ transport system ATPase subunit NatA